MVKKASICLKTRKAWKRTTKANKSAIAAPNQLNQNFRVDAPNKVWVSDITYVPTQEGWLYVSVSLDLFSRKVIGLSMDSNLHTPIVMRTLNQAPKWSGFLGGCSNHLLIRFFEKGYFIIKNITTVLFVLDEKIN